MISSMRLNYATLREIIRGPTTDKKVNARCSYELFLLEYQLTTFGVFRKMAIAGHVYHFRWALEDISPLHLVMDFLKYSLSKEVNILIKLKGNSLVIQMSSTGLFSLN